MSAVQLDLNNSKALLHKTIVKTPIGDMIAIADDHALHFLEFDDRRGFDLQFKRLGGDVVEGDNAVLGQLKTEMAAYFSGSLKEFTLPLNIYGSEFQRSVMEVLRSIPYGEMRSYAEQANSLGNPKAVRAVARGNSMNQIAIIIPCHRVIGSNGTLTGYAGGLGRKEWLLNHEMHYS